MPRTYDNSKRERAAARTRDAIAAGTEALLASGPASDLTLAAIAARAGVTVQTVLRHMGSREGCLLAAAERVAQRVQSQRGASEPGDLEGALEGLLSHYEADGALILNLLAQETSDPFAQEATARGRAFHRAWVERCFGPLWPSPPAQAQVDALVAATDLYVWKLLRLDLGRQAEETRAVMTRMVRATLALP